VIPRCTSVGAALSAQTFGQAMRAFFGAAVESVVAIFTESFISLAAVLGMFTFCFCFAVAGGVGALRWPRRLIIQLCITSWCIANRIVNRIPSDGTDMTVLTCTCCIAALRPCSLESLCMPVVKKCDACRMAGSTLAGTAPTGSKSSAGLRCSCRLSCTAGHVPIYVPR